MPEQTVTQFETIDGAAWIRLNRPEARNALSSTLVNELYDHIRLANDNPEVRCLVITGNGSAFCSGVDLKSPPGQIMEGNRAVSYPDLLQAILDSPKPVIAAVNGAAFAGGLGLVAAADIAITVEHAVYSFSEVRIGVIPAVISVVCVPKLGKHHATRLFLTGERFTGSEAVDFGLVHHAVAEENLADKVRQQIDMIRLGGPLAVQESKRLIRPHCGTFRLRKASAKLRP